MTYGRLIIGVVLLLCSFGASGQRYVWAGMTEPATNWAGVNAWCNSTYYAGTVVISDFAVFNAKVVDTSVEATCTEGSGGPVVAAFTIYIVPFCLAGEAGALTNLTTVASIDNLGQLTAATSPANPQCSSACVVSAPVGLPSGYVCSAFRNPTETFAVGASVWVSCVGSVETPIELTGETCNVGGADFIAMATSLAKPLGYVAVDAAPPGEVPPSETTLGKPVDITAVCNDQNGNGLDDTTGLACSVQAAAALKLIVEGKKNEMAAVGQGPSLAGDVAVLSSANGGWFALPDELTGGLGILNPSTVCMEFSLTLPAYGDRAQAVYETTGWCELKSKLEPFLALAMYVITLFVGMSQFRRVA